MPFISVGRYFDPIFSCEAVGKLLLAITPPNNAIDGDFARKFELNPAFATLIGNPASAVSIFTVIKVLELVDIGIGKDALRVLRRNR